MMGGAEKKKTFFVSPHRFTCDKLFPAVHDKEFKSRDEERVFSYGSHQKANLDWIIVESGIEFPSQTTMLQ
jgi:hypothetical protein